MELIILSFAVGTNALCAEVMSSNHGMNTDITMALIIGGIIVLSLVVFGLAIYFCIKCINDAKNKELKLRQEHEIAKMIKEAAIRMVRDEYNAEQAKMCRERISNKIQAFEEKADNREAKIRDTVSSIENSTSANK
jgi:heme/copper-type cytochrome/quinol oxidase subunit 2